VFGRSRFVIDLHTSKGFRAPLIVLFTAVLLTAAALVHGQDGAPLKISAESEAVRERAFAELGAGRWAEAERLFDSISDETGRDPATLYGRALAKFNVGKVEEAGALLDAGISILGSADSNNRLLADCLVLSAIISAREGANADAVSKLREAVALVPDHYDAVFSLGRALFGNGDVKGAAEYFRRALELRPDDLRARFFFATALENLGQDTDALKEYRSMVAADPDSVNGNLGLGVLLVKTEGDDSVEGLKALRKVISLNGRNYEARITLGKALVRKGEFADAIVHLNVAAELAPKNPEPFYQLALAYRRLGMKDEAAKAMETVRRIHASRRGVPGDQQ